MKRSESRSSLKQKSRTSSRQPSSEKLGTAPSPPQEPLQYTQDQQPYVEQYDPNQYQYDPNVQYDPNQQYEGDPNQEYMEGYGGEAQYPDMEQYYGDGGASQVYEEQPNPSPNQPE